MKYTLNNIALPIFFASVNSKSIVSRPFELVSKPISALHYHNVAELGICLSGSGETHVGNRIYSYSEGYVQVLPPYAPHLSCSYEGARSSSIFISFDAQSMFKNAGIFFPSDTLEFAGQDQFLCGVYQKNEFPELTAAVNAIVSASRKNDRYTELSISFAIANFLIVSARAKEHLGEKKHRSRSKRV